MGTHSGLLGVIDGVESVRQWTINESSQPRRAVASNTKGGSARRKGVKDWTGSFNAYGHTPAVRPGEVFAFDGLVSPDNDTIGGTGQIYSGDIIIDSVVITWNWATNEIISYVANFSGHGALTQSTGTLSDASTPSLTESHSGKVVVGSTDLPGVTQAVLTLLCENKAYVDSTTGLWTKRAKGPFDWTLAVTLDDASRTNLSVASDVELKLHVGVADFWHLKWGHQQDYTGLTVNPETGDIVQATANFAMNGYNPGEGCVIDPADNVWWGTAPA